MGWKAAQVPLHIFFICAPVFISLIKMGYFLINKSVVNVPVGEWGSRQDNAALGVALSLMTLMSRQVDLSLIS